MSAISMWGQENISWDILADVIWTEEYDSLSGYSNVIGEFGEHLASFDGQEVYISGYVIPLDAMGFSFALSRSSYASCFFCGQAGPETVMELKVAPRSIPPVDQKNTLIKFKGKLMLLRKNPKGLNYRLENAVRVD